MEAETSAKGEASAERGVMSDEQDFDPDWEDVTGGLATGISEPCRKGKHDECTGFGPNDAHVVRTMICVCPCHKVPHRA